MNKDNDVPQKKNSKWRCTDLNHGSRSKRRLVALTAITIMAIVSVLTVYAVTIGNFTGGEVTVGGVASSTITYNPDNNEAGTWTTTLTSTSVSDPWYSRLEISAGDYSGPVTITWQLQNKTDSTSWADISGASVTTTLNLAGTAEDVYASSDGGNTGNHNWSTDVPNSGTYRIVVAIESD